MTLFIKLQCLVYTVMMSTILWNKNQTLNYIITSSLLHSTSSGKLTKDNQNLTYLQIPGSIIESSVNWVKLDNNIQLPSLLFKTCEYSKQ